MTDQPTNDHAEAVAALTSDGDTFDLLTCLHCGETIEDDDGTYYHPDTMQARCDGPDDEEGVSWTEVARSAEPKGTLRLRIEADDVTILEEQGEGVWCGRLAWDDRSTNDYGYRSRPEGFDGRAEVIHRDRSDRMWWQVPADIELGSDVHRSMRSTLQDLLHYGYQVVTVELLQGVDAYGRPIVVNVASLGMVEPFPTADYLAEVVGDLVAEVLV